MNTRHALRRYVRHLIAFRHLSLLVLVSLTLALGFGALQLRIEIDPDTQLPQEHPYIRALNESHRLFGDKNLVVVALFPKNRDPFTPHFLAKVWDITTQLGALPGAVPTLLQSIGSPAVKDLETTHDALKVRPYMQGPSLTLTEASAIRHRIAVEPAHDGLIVSFDRTAVAIYATIELSSQLPGYEQLHRAVSEVLAANEDGTFEYALSGPVVVVAAIGEYAAQMRLFFVLALAVIGAIHYEAFRSLQAIILPLLTGLLAVVWSLGAMGWLGVTIDSLNSTTPILILAVAAGHAVQILKRYQELLARSTDRDSALIESLADVGPAMIAAATIACLSFLSLASFGTYSMRVFGAFAALGIASSVIVELTLIPSLRALLPVPPHRQEREGLLDRLFSKWLIPVVTNPQGARRCLVATGTIALAACAIGYGVRVDTSFKRSFAEGDRIRQDDERINKSFAGTNVLVFRVEGPHENSLVEPENIRAIRDFQDSMARVPGVRKVVSVLDILKRMHSELAPLGASKVPETRELATQYLFLYSLSGGRDSLQSMITTDNRVAKIVAFVQDDSTEYGNTIIAEALELGAHLPKALRLFVSGTLASNSALTDTMVRGKLANIVQVCILAVTVAAVLLRSIIHGIVVIAPLVLALSTNFGAMRLFDVPLDVSTVSVSVMAVGIGADYAIYLIWRIRWELQTESNPAEAISVALLTSGKAVVFVSTAIAGGYLTLCLSGFPMMQRLGALVALAMLSSSVGALFVVPAAMRLLWAPTAKTP